MQRLARWRNADNPELCFWRGTGTQYQLQASAQTRFCLRGSSSSIAELVGACFVRAIAVGDTLRALLVKEKPFPFLHHTPHSKKSTRQCAAVLQIRSLESSPPAKTAVYFQKPYSCRGTTSSPPGDPVTWSFQTLQLFKEGSPNHHLAFVLHEAVNSGWSPGPE